VADVQVTAKLGQFRVAAATNIGTYVCIEFTTFTSNVLHLAIEQVCVCIYIYATALTHKIGHYCACDQNKFHCRSHNDGYCGAYDGMGLGYKTG